jgi:hypothetical protein
MIPSGFGTFVIGFVLAVWVAIALIVALVLGGLALIFM